MHLCKIHRPEEVGDEDVDDRKVSGETRYSTSPRSGGGADH